MIRTGKTRRSLSVLLSLMTALMLMAGASATGADAAAETVTIKNGGIQYYGSGSAGTHLRWITHINGEPVDLGDVPGVTTSYAYCVQPYLDTPKAGTYNVVVVEDDGSGRVAAMRKMVYYLPGAYGFTKVTGSRWFGSNNKTGATDYAIGHMVLSYIYEGYPDSGKIWSGVRANVRAKVLEIAADIGNLPDPPKDFEIFWVRVEGKQDTFGAFYREEVGSLNVRKDSANTLMTGGNVNYSLEGAQYTVYDDAGCSSVSKTTSGADAVITVGAGGTSGSVELTSGLHYLKETKAPPGYALDTDVHSVEVGAGTTTTYNATDRPKCNPVDILIQKTDMETGKPKPQGGASLEGAEYTVTFYAVKTSPGMSDAAMEAAVSGKAPAKINGRDAVWVFRTDKEGRIRMSDPETYMIKDRSAPLYTSSSGKPVFPLGVITVKETKAPEGYEIDKDTHYAAVTDAGTAENPDTLKVFTGSRALKEQVIRGDVHFSKAAEGRKKLAGVRFRFTSLTTGESHILVTDRNGFASTAADWNPHSQSTNEGLTARDGVWFNGYDDEEEGAQVNDSLGALPYDTYKFEEIRSEANEGYELISDVITIERPRVDVDLGTYDDEKSPDPLIETKARDDESKTGTAVADGKVLIVDEVSYKGVSAGRSYTVEGILMDKATAKPVRDDSGNEVRGSTGFYAEAPDGTVEVKFSMSAETLAGKDVVVYEYLKQDDKLVVAHADINNRKQTVKLAEAPKPELATDARDAESGSGKAVADRDVTIIDTVEYRNLKEGVLYTIEGILMDKDTGKPLMDDSGSAITAKVSFTAKTMSGSIEVPFRFSGAKLAGKDAVVFEYLKVDGETVASHADIKSRSQTVRLVKPRAAGKSPDTGDSHMQLLYCLAVMAAAAELLILTLKSRNDRLN